MNKEETTILAIQKAVPGIMKRQFGCYVIVKGIREDNPGCEYDIIVDERIKNGKITLGYFGNVPLTEIKIIGRPITLEDVMIAIENPSISFRYFYKDKLHIQIEKAGRMLGIWQLNIPFSDQSKETKELIGNLILNK